MRWMPLVKPTESSSTPAIPTQGCSGSGCRSTSSITDNPAVAGKHRHLRVAFFIWRSLMTAGVVKTQGTHLYFANPTSTDPQLVKLACPTGMSGLGGAKDQTEITCLDNTDDKEYVPGLGNPGQVSVPFNLIP